MTFDEKAKFLRTLPQFKVIPIPEVRAVAFAAKENQTDLINIVGSNLYLSSEDIEKIIREYPDLATKL